MNNRAWFVFGGGGTGGHLFPALAVVEVLRERSAPVDVSFFCTQRALDSELLGSAGVEAMPLSVRPVPSRPWRWPAFAWHWRRSVAACARVFARRRPAVVVGAGGYASGPPVAAALRLGIPTFILNPDAVPGRANRHLARRHGLSGIFAQWPVTRRHFDPDAPVEVTGCPVRAAFRLAGSADGQAARAGARQSFGLDPDRPALLVTGASQGARTINEAMMLLAGDVAAGGWQVLHLSGQGDRERVAAAYDRAGCPAVVQAFTERMAEAICAAELVISRAGASTLAELLAVGRPSVLLPYPFHRDRHQWHNGAVLAEAGAAAVVDDLKEAAGNARQLKPVLTSLMADDARRASMGQAARTLGCAEAANLIGRRLCQAGGIEPPAGL